ncbi:unnamed protein product [Arabidopsis halleri]
MTEILKLNHFQTQFSLMKYNQAGIKIQLGRNPRYVAGIFKIIFYLVETQFIITKSYSLKLLLY